MAFRGLHETEEEPAAPEHHPFLFEDGSECKDDGVGRSRVEKSLALIFQKPHSMQTMTIVFH